MNKHLAAILIPPLLPVCLAQGLWLKRRTPRLPDAGGPLEGTFGGTGKSIKLVAVGESTVAGVGAATHETALAGQLAMALSRHSQCSVEWQVVARSGINARKTLADLVPKLSGCRADVVLIALGVNDSIEFHTARRWALDLERLITAIRGEVGDVLILLAGVPPLDCFPLLPQPLSFALGARSAALGRASVSLAKRMKRLIHVPFQIEKGSARELFCPDGFHPSELGYSLWAEQLAAAYAEYSKRS